MPPEKPLADAQEVGRDAGVLAGPHGAGAAVAGEDLVERRAAPRADRRARAAWRRYSAA